MLISIEQYTKAHPETVLVAGYEHGIRAIDYYLDLESDVLLHVNSRHRDIFFRQPVDFMLNQSDREKTRWVTSLEGYAHNQPVPETQYTYCVYRYRNHAFYYDDASYHCRVMQHVESPAVGRTFIEEYSVDYTETDTLQTAFDRARVFSRLILRKQLTARQPLREFPTF